ncbi:MAG TPA: OmpA family protein [Bacteroidia bacterium]|jgi:outer membrane protein OmpA-like peptidoglycan-associated protein
MCFLIRENRPDKARRTILFSILFLFCFSAPAQKRKNLIPNPSFEEHKGKGTDIKTATPWKGVGTVDYYLKPDKRDTSKYKGARTGTAYAGLRFQSDYKEYMHVKLLEPLEKGQVYNFKMYIRLLEFNNVTVTVKQLGAYFSDFEFKVGMVFEEDGLVDTTYNKGIAGTFNWMIIQGDYKAHGGEKYVIIGNFRTKMKDDFVKKNKWSLFEFKEAYYYIDDISLRKKNIPFDSVAFRKEQESLPMYPGTYAIGQGVEIQKIKFEKGTANLLNSSYKYLDLVVKTLNEHPFMEIEIVGHTDNSGNESDNKKLSKERAKVIYEYFKSQDVINPMTYKGMGSAKPIVANDTEENRLKNTRVEFVVIKE